MKNRQHDHVVLSLKQEIIDSKRNFEKEVEKIEFNNANLTRQINDFKQRIDCVQDELDKVFEELFISQLIIFGDSIFHSIFKEVERKYSTQKRCRIFRIETFGKILKIILIFYSLDFNKFKFFKDVRDQLTKANHTLSQNVQNLLESNKNKANLEQELLVKHKQIKEMEVESYDLKKQLNELKIVSDFSLSEIKKEVG